MRELLSADWYMMRKQRGIWWLCLCAIGLAVLFAIVGGMNAAEGYPVYMDGGPLGIGSMIAAAAAALLCGVSFDNAFSEGTIRNKVATGRTRAQVYWASYLSCTMAAVLVFACYVLALILSVLSFVDVGREAAEITETTLLSLCTIPAYTALYCAVCMIGGRKGVGIACLVVFVAVFVVAWWLMMSLDEPETMEVYSWDTTEMDVVIDEHGNRMFEETAAAVDTVPNPHYVAEPARSVYTFFVNFLPAGQSMQLLFAAEPALVWYDLGFCAVFCGIGLIVLKRRDIN